MAKVLRSVGNISLFLAGVAVGIVLSVNTDMDKSPIFQFSNVVYALGIGMMVSLSVLLRKAAARIS